MTPSRAERRNDYRLESARSGTVQAPTLYRLDAHLCRGYTQTAAMSYLGDFLNGVRN